MKLSIITINKNNAEGLCKTINSVISQTFNDYEYLIIDGASNDNSVDIIIENKEKINFWISEPDTGIYNAMNKGITKACGEYCLFLNSGDYLYNKDVLTTVFKENIIEDISYGEQVTIVNDELIKSKFIDPQCLTFNSFLSTTLPHQCTFIKRNLFDLVGLYNENNKIVSDWEWNSIALFRYNCSLRKLNIIISCYDTNGISNDESLCIFHKKEKRQSLERNFPRIIIDVDNYFHLLKRYKNIPRIVSFFFNFIRK